MNPSVAIKKKRRISIGNVAGLLIATSFAGQLLGFLRTKLVNANFRRLDLIVQMHISLPLTYQIYSFLLLQLVLLE